MKFFSTLFFLSFSALAFSAAVSMPMDEDYELAKREVSNAKYVPTTLPDGKKSIAVYDGDVLEGSLVEGPDGEVTAYDAFGKEIDLDNPEEDDENGDKRKRASKFSILRKFYSFIKKYGTRAWVSNAMCLAVYKTLG